MQQEDRAPGTRQCQQPVQQHRRWCPLKKYLIFLGGTRVHWIQKITELCEAFTIWHQYLNTGLKMKLYWSQLNISWVLKIKADRNTLSYMNSSPLLEIEFHFQDLLMTLSYFGCIPEETGERWKCCHIKGIQFEQFPNHTRYWIGYINSEETPLYFNKEFSANLWTICQWQKNQKNSKRKQNVSEDRKALN